MVTVSNICIRNFSKKFYNFSYCSLILHYPECVSNSIFSNKIILRSFVVNYIT